MVTMTWWLSGFISKPSCWYGGTMGRTGSAGLPKVPVVLVKHLREGQGLLGAVPFPWFWWGTSFWINPALGSATRALGAQALDPDEFKLRSCRTWSTPKSNPSPRNHFSCIKKVMAMQKNAPQGTHSEPRFTLPPQNRHWPHQDTRTPVLRVAKPPQNHRRSHMKPRWPSNPRRGPPHSPRRFSPSP